MAMLSHSCSQIKSQLWVGGSNPPPFEDPISVFSVFGLAQQIHPMVSCSFVGLVLNGDLRCLVPDVAILEAWSRVAILLPGGPRLSDPSCISWGLFGDVISSFT